MRQTDGQGRQTRKDRQRKTLREREKRERKKKEEKRKKKEIRKGDRINLSIQGTSKLTFNTRLMQALQNEP